LIARRPVADIREVALAEHVPLHAEIAAGLPRSFDETHLQHDLLRLQHTDRIDDVRAELLGDQNRLVHGRAVGRGAGEHDAAVDRRHFQTGVRETAAYLGLQLRGVEHDLDVEYTDQLFAFGIGRHARRAVLLAQDR